MGMRIQLAGRTDARFNSSAELAGAARKWRESPAEAAAMYGNISTWGTSLVRSMGHLFKGARSFNADLSGWDVSRVTNMGGMFYSASSFNADLSPWDDG